MKFSGPVEGPKCYEIPEFLENSFTNFKDTNAQVLKNLMHLNTQQGKIKNIRPSITSENIAFRI